MKKIILSTLLGLVYILTGCLPKKNGLDGYKDIKFDMSLEQVKDITKNQKNFKVEDGYVKDCISIRYDTEIIDSPANVSVNFCDKDKTVINMINVSMYSLADSDMWNKVASMIKVKYPQATETPISKEETGYGSLIIEQSFMFADGSSINMLSIQGTTFYSHISYKPRPKNLGL